MATIHRVMYANIGGGSKTLTSLYMNSGGSRKTISSAYANIGGSRKQIFPTYITYIYTWNRYTIDTATGYYRQTLTDQSFYLRGTSWVTNVKDYEVESTHFRIQYGGSYQTYSADFSTWISGSAEDNDLYGTWGTSSYIRFGGVQDESTIDSMSEYLIIGVTVDSFVSGTYNVCGSYVGQVTSTDYYEYPYNDEQDGYWYIYQGQA